MAQNLRQRKRKASVVEREVPSCPVCMEPTKDDCFSFPCGHLICSECNEKMILRRFLACPTCRTPREGVSQQEVDSANLSRVAMDTVTDTGLSANNNVTHMAIIFFPNESSGANPFTPLDAVNNAATLLPVAPDTDSGEALEHALQTDNTAGGDLPLRRVSVVRLRGSMRRLVDQLLLPGTITDFLAQREVVRRSRSDS